MKMINCFSGFYCSQIFFIFPSYHSYAVNDVYEDQEAGRGAHFVLFFVRFSWVLLCPDVCAYIVEDPRCLSGAILLLVEYFRVP